MDWTAAIDIYCERTSAAFWAEPVNAWTNLAFPAAALWATVAARRRGGASGAFWTLVALAALVGVGSFLFHTFATVWSEYADTIPIWTFVAATVYVAAGRVAGQRPGPTFGVLLVAAVVGIVVFAAATDPTSDVPQGPDPLNGSGQYVPALLALAAFTAVAWIRAMPTRGLLLAVTFTFLASLMFRTIDLRVCPAFPLGTHFLWHLLNGLMVGLILMVMLATDPHDRPPGADQGTGRGRATGAGFTEVGRRKFGFGPPTGRFSNGMHAALLSDGLVCDPVVGSLNLAAHKPNGRFRGRAAA